MSECACGCQGAGHGQDARELLERYHQFPGEYMFKVIGFAGPDFERQVCQAAQGALGSAADAQVQARCRPSSGGRYLAVTLEVAVADAEQVLAIYAALKQVQGVVVLV